MKLFALSLMLSSAALLGYHDDAEARVDGVHLVEKVERDGDEIVIPYEKYQLDNGLTIILHEDRSDPLVHVDVTYHVGSGREEVGKSGFAHFFEHMMFQGSENVADEEHVRLVTEGGGWFNGSTTGDRTNYFQSVPNNNLERVLWLEADRMGFLLPAVTQEKFEVQRATVKNERGQRLDNRPYGLLQELLSEALYPEGHPYSWLPIGYPEDLDRVGLDDLKAFFLRWYGPNNATLTIGGDFDKETTLRWIEKYFGPIPRGPEVDDPSPVPVELDADRYISFEDNVTLPLLYIAFPTVHAMHPDEPALNVLMTIIGYGDTSLLTKNLVKSGLAVDASSTHFCRELSCTFSVVAYANPESQASLSTIEDVIRDTFQEFERRGVTEEDLARFKGQVTARRIFRLESVHGKVSRLADYQTYFGNPNLIAEDISRHNDVTTADVMRVYNQYLKDRPSVRVSAVPKRQTDAVAAPDNWTKPPRTLPEYQDAPSDGIAAQVAADSFDRSVVPEVGDRPVVTAPEIWRDRTAAGVPIIGAVSDEVPTTTFQFRIDAGQRYEPVEKLGIAALTAEMLDEETQRSTKEELSDRLQKLGSQVSITANDDNIIVRVHALTENLDETLEIVTEKLLAPKFEGADFMRLRSRAVETVGISEKISDYVANNVFEVLLYGSENSFAYADHGTAEGLQNISLEDVKDYYANMVKGAGAEIIVVSDLDKAELLPKLSPLVPWTPEERAAPPLKPFPDLQGGTLYLLDKPGAAQSEIRIGSRSMTYDATGPFYRAKVMNFALGANFNSRINMNLREDKGYTYGARTNFAANDYIGGFVASTAVRTDVTDAAIKEIMSEIDDYARNGMSPEELAFAKNALSQREALAYENPEAKAGYLANILNYGLDPDYIAQQHAVLEHITIDELNALARTLLQTDEMIIVVVGDKSAILPGLTELGFPIVELDRMDQ